MVVNSLVQPHYHELYNYSYRKNNNILHEEVFVPYSLEKADDSGLQEEVSGDILSEDSDIGINIAEKRMADQLISRDAEVRAHEHAHIAAAGGIATGGAHYIYMTGPDGKMYAVGGEVSIDTSPVPGDPEKTIQKAQKIRRAALSPANPSAQDMRVAAAATRMEQQARAELTKEKSKENGEEDYLSRDYLRPSLEDMYSEKSSGGSEELDQRINIFA